MSNNSTPYQPALAVPLPARPRPEGAPLNGHPNSNGANNSNGHATTNGNGNGNGNYGTMNPVWTLTRSETRSVTTPLISKCDRHDREGGVCCKELKSDDERRLVDPDIVRDVSVPFLPSLSLISFGLKE